MKKLTALLSMSLFFVAVQTTLAAPGDKDLAELYLSTHNPKLTKQEKSALAIAERWKASNASGMAPVSGANGTITFLYGAQQPSIVCAVLQVCDVALQEGEQVNSINLGDTARWTIEPAITGSGPTEIQHLIIKPMDVGLETSLVVTTNRRTYHFQLRSHRTQYMPRIAFSYPEEAMAKWDALKHRETTQRQEKTLPTTGEYLGDLNFDYTVTSDSDIAWKPIRVYNDGQKTLIQMPAAMAQTEAPTLLVIRKKGDLFTDDDTVMVNYRVQSDRYVVDTVFDRAILIAGVGSSQDVVTIERGK
jgi:type IV secretion system protein VirB9